ncbi:hypothetical protein quinque_016216 [Culex quinquefasciatus]
MGSQEVHVKKGSTISLSCVVNVHASSISCRLLLTRATLRDSGNYTCVLSGTISSSVQVHVLNASKLPLCPVIIPSPAYVQQCCASKDDPNANRTA